MENKDLQEKFGSVNWKKKKKNLLGKIVLFTS